MPLCSRGCAPRCSSSPTGAKRAGGSSTCSEQITCTVYCSFSAVRPCISHRVSAVRCAAAAYGRASSKADEAICKRFMIIGVVVGWLATNCSPTPPHAAVLDHCGSGGRLFIYPNTRMRLVGRHRDTHGMWVTALDTNSAEAVATVAVWRELRHPPPPPQFGGNCGSGPGTGLLGPTERQFLSPGETEHRVSILGETEFQFRKTDFQFLILGETGFQFLILGETGFQFLILGETGFQFPILGETGFQFLILGETGSQFPILGETDFQLHKIWMLRESSAVPLCWARQALGLRLGWLAQT